MKNLYSVLMVDDEDEVIRIIRRKMNWEEMGFYVCGQAKNGMEALEMVDELQPDIVMTDIKMPYMDGLELAKRLKEKYSDLRIIIFSGFDEFDYVKKAIGLEVEEYLLKPIDAEEIRKVFGKVRNSLNKERNLRNNIEHLEKHYAKSLPLLRESFFASLMEENYSNQSLKEYLDEYEIKLDHALYAITVIHVSGHSVEEGISTKLLRLSVRQFMDDSFLNHENNYIFNYRENILVLAQFDKTEELAKYTDLCDRFCKSVKRNCNALVSIGIGKCVDSIQDLSVSYKGAREALSYRTLYGAGNAINIMEIDPHANRMDLQDIYDLHELFKMIKMGDENRVQQAIDSYIQSLLKANLNIQEFQLVLMELVTNWYRFLRNNEIEVEKVIRNSDNVYLTLEQMESMDQIKEWLLDISMQSYQMVQEQRMNKTTSFVRKAEQYVQDHYGEPELNIDMICSELGLSSAYFSTVFKRETGKTFINYLTEVRMKEAERLLVEKNEKKYIIAQKVGYSDPGYFSYVFKKYFGVSPMKYNK